MDHWNGGCNTVPDHPFQQLESDEYGGRLVCGVSGWYPFDGESFRDTDWYIMNMGPAGAIEIEMDAELPTYFFELSPQDCDAVGVLQMATAGPCSQAFMTIAGYAFLAPVWFWVGPTTFVPPDGLDNDYDYVFWATGLEPCCQKTIATETRTWGAVKSLYRLRDLRPRKRGLRDYGAAGSLVYPVQTGTKGMLGLAGPNPTKGPSHVPK